MTKGYFRDSIVKQLKYFSCIKENTINTHTHTHIHTHIYINNCKCPWCSVYYCRKWTWQNKFNSWMKLIAFHITLIPLV